MLQNRVILSGQSLRRCKKRHIRSARYLRDLSLELHRGSASYDRVSDASPPNWVNIFRRRVFESFGTRVSRAYRSSSQRRGHLGSFYRIPPDNFYFPIFRITLRSTFADSDFSKNRNPAPPSLECNLSRITNPNGNFSRRSKQR